jgi:tetratricopeptide (TPR) repeat protein/tRNA A-37 threonylcarbamoyl transferase component Bud32
MANTHRCSNCGAEYRGDDPNGLCPRCLMVVAGRKETAGDSSDLTATGAVALGTGQSRQPAEGDPDATETHSSVSSGGATTAGATGGWATEPTDTTRTADGVGSPRDLLRGTTVRYFGDYEIHEELGRGGMGVVYKARQVSLNRPVALKMIRAGVLAEAAELQRFQNEAEAVALLDHPGIVPVHEIGEHDGQRYFSMKLVEGGNLAEKVGSFKENPRGAASLVAETAEAVHHAHMRGILHRDLKPANILIDAEDHPHVTDFGLAKRVEGNVEMTQSGAILGTPAYMSPEQASGRRGSITTATDVHGLGAILYALLTGKAPFSGDSVIDTIDAVRNRPPEPPNKLNARVPRDLETICLKCLEKDPRRRYASAHQLAEDLSNWLHSRPITARRVRTAERAWLWCKRRPAVAALTAAVVLAAVTGTAAVIAVQTKANNVLENKNRDLRSANHALDQQRARAEDRELQAIDAVRKFRDAIANEPELKKTPVLDGLRKRLLSEPLAFFRALRDQFHADRDTRAESLVRLAAASHDLGVLDDEIGNKQDALIAYQESLAVRQKLVDANPTDTNYLAELARSHNNIAALLGATGKPAEAFQAGRAAIEIRQKLVDANPTDTGFQRDLAASCNNLGALLRAAGKPGEALESVRSGLAIQQTLADANPTVTEFQRQLARSHNNIGVLLRDSGSAVEALQAYKSALAVQRKLAESHPTVAEFQNELAGMQVNMAVLLSETQKPAEALEACKAALIIHRRVASDNPTVTAFQRDLATAHNNTGALLRSTGKPVEALEAYESALAIRKKLADNNPTVTVFQDEVAASHRNIGGLLSETGKPAAALDAYERALKIGQKLTDAFPNVPEFQINVAQSHDEIGTVLRTMGKPGEALAEFESALPIKQKLADANPNAANFQASLAACHNSIGLSLSGTGKPAAALKAYERALAIQQKLARERTDTPVFASELGGTLNNAAIIHLHAKRFAEAGVLLGQAIEWQRKALDANPRNPMFRQFLGNHLVNKLAAARGTGDSVSASEAERQIEKLRDSDPAMVALDAPLAAIIKGEKKPKSEAERLQLGQRAYNKGLHATAVRLWGEALEANPKLGEDRQLQLRYNAACAAVLAGCGMGKDNPPPDEAAKARLRKQALDWLEQEFSAWKQVSTIAGPSNSELVADTLAHWKKDADLASVRSPEALLRLPLDEQAAWEVIWEEVEVLRTKADAARK